MHVFALSKMERLYESVKCQDMMQRLFEDPPTTYWAGKEPLTDVQPQFAQNGNHPAHRVSTYELKREILPD